jgi:hypothetical protein
VSQKEADAKKFHVGSRLLVISVDGCQIVVNNSMTGCWMSNHLTGWALPMREKVACQRLSEWGGCTTSILHWRAWRLRGEWLGRMVGFDSGQKDVDGGPGKADD